MKKKLGEFILEHRWISKEELTKVLALQQALRKAGQSEEKTYLGQLLVKRNLLTPQQLTQLLSEQASQEEPDEGSFIETPSHASEKETAEDDLLGDIESFSSKAKPSTNQITNTSTLLPNFSQPKKEDQNRRTQKLWKEFEVEEKKRYAVLKTLGEGGMGIVELVKDQLLGREVARKTIKMQRRDSNQLSRKEEVLLWRFKKEAAITALLEHPHIIPLYEMQRPEQGEIQFTMRKVEGQTLRNLLQKKRKGELELDETQILNIFRKVCDAIAYAHSKGVIHRDLKPDNVMVGQFGEVYVMDWGISKRLEESPEEEKDLEVLLTQQEVEKDDLYKTIGGMGTPGYMSPEQQENASNVTPQSDIYSLGKILRECFTLLSPMEELKQQAKKSLQAKNATKKKTTEGIPEEIEAIEKKATQENPTDRYESVQEFIQDLEKYQ
ncbi:MAG: protein kinase, partial [Planctomycetota bacterium]